MGKMSMINRLLHAVVVGGSLSLGIVCCSCSGDEPEDNAPRLIKDAEDLSSEIDREFLITLADTEEPKSYELVGVELYDRNDNTNGLWKQIDLYDLVGWHTSLPEEISFYGGKMYRRLRLFGSPGPAVLCDPVYAYEKATGKKVGLYLLYDLSPEQMDLENPQIYPEWIKIIGCTSEKLSISCERSYQGGETGRGGTHLEILTYAPTETWWWPSDDSKALVCGSSIDEVVIKFVELLKAKFGEEIPASYMPGSSKPYRIQYILELLERHPKGMIFAY